MARENEQLREELKMSKVKNEKGGYQRLVSGLTRRWEQSEEFSMENK
jgi:hypothetical protein